MILTRFYILFFFSPQVERPGQLSDARARNRLPAHRQRDQVSAGLPGGESPRAAVCHVSYLF